MTTEDPMEVDKGSQRVDDDVQFDEDKVWLIAYPSLT